MQIRKFGPGMIFINKIYVMFINVRLKLLLIFQTQFISTLAAFQPGTVQWRKILEAVRTVLRTRDPSSRGRRSQTRA